VTRWTVLGGRGFVGSRLVDHLRVKGAEVWVPAREDPALWDRDLGHVVYGIGLTGNFRQRPFETMEAHVGVLSRMLECARFESLTYLSSTRVYMGNSRTDEDALLTVQPGDLSYLYNLSKLAGEALCHASGRTGVRVARLSNVVGPGMDAASGNFVAALLSEAASGHILLNSLPESEKDYIDVRDVVVMLQKIALHGSQRVYNLASGVQTQHLQWVRALCAHFGCSWAASKSAQLQSFASIDNGRLVREFGFVPKSVGLETVVLATQSKG
jgi:nucleoside-diphosphate-sugar epimerase